MSKTVTIEESLVFDVRVHEVFINNTPVDDFEVTVCGDGDLYIEVTEAEAVKILREDNSDEDLIALFGIKVNA